MPYGSSVARHAAQPQHVEVDIYVRLPVRLEVRPARLALRNQGIHYDANIQVTSSKCFNLGAALPAQYAIRRSCTLFEQTGRYNQRQMDSLALL